MRWLLMLLTAFLTLSSVFAWDPGPAPGVKIKNAILYMLAMTLFARFALLRRFKLQLPSITITFLILTVYCVFSYIAVVLFIDYPHYKILRNGFDLKNRILDQMLFFLVFFYGAQSREDAIALMKVVLAAWVISHVSAILDAAGIVHFGDIERRPDGRVQGTVGESNQYGAFVALTLPAVVALAYASKGLVRALWGAAALLTLATLLMTVSRGAYVGVTFACMVGAWMFRRYLSGPQLLRIGAGVFGMLLVVGVVVGIWYGDLIHERLIGDVSANDMAGASSGRTEIWANALALMISKPWTFITGFGWNSYWIMPLRYSPHNYYLNQWFNLGLTGLFCCIALLAIPIRVARTAAFKGDSETTPLFVGFVISALAFGGANFFVDIYEPWLYYWAYAGVILRLAMLQQVPAVEAPAPVDTSQSSGESSYARPDPFGWVTPQRS
jgi:O-antigen ligase